MTNTSILNLDFLDLNPSIQREIIVLFKFETIAFKHSFERKAKKDRT